MNQSLNIHQRINEVRRAIPYIRKDAEVQGYKGVTHDQVTAALHDEIVKNGILIYPDLLADNVVETKSGSGKAKIRYEALYTISFVNIDNPEDKISIDISAHADDFGDKAPGKAASYAVKTAMLKMFLLETGENDESRLEGERKQDKLIEHTKTQVDELLDSGDSLGIFLLSKSIGNDAWTDVFNSAPPGSKSKFKAACASAESEGGAIYRSINSAITASDAFGAKELIEDVSDDTKRLLAAKLGTSMTATLGELIKSLEDN